MAYIGSSTPRIDGRAKVTGAAKYAAEFDSPDLAHGFIVTSPIAKGRIRRIDAAEAKAVPGVIDVLTHEHRVPMAGSDEAYKDDVAPEGSPFRPLYDAEIKFAGQPVAVVVAADSETARFAAALVRVEYEAAPHVTDIRAARTDATPARDTPTERGDAAGAFAAAAVKHEAEYSMPMESHNPMELFGSTVIWEGGRLTVYDKTQGVQNVQRYLCSVFGLESDAVRVVSPFVGGAFGLALRPQFQLVLAVMAASLLKRSVRLVLTRQQMYALGHRPAMIQRIQLGARADGGLDAITHDAVTDSSRYEDFHRHDTIWSGLLYKSANARYQHRIARLDVSTSCDMRAPSAVPGVYALEAAMDELAVALDMDPLALRLRCYSEHNQNDGNIPYSSKALRECYAQAAEAFGWSKRSSKPRSMRDGTELVGWGMATGVWEALHMPITVRIALTSNGHAEVACATSDIGTGTYTIMAQVAADALGLPIENITIKLGDSTLPASPVEGGSWIAASVSHGIVNTSKAIRDELLRLSHDMPGDPLSGDVVLTDGRLALLQDASRAVAVADIMRHAGIDRLEREKSTEFEQDGKHANNTHAAVFAEVKIDEELDIIRVTRIVSAVAAGRILNTRTAHNQVMGGVIWGIGAALHEETHIDHRFGRVMNADIAEYHVPVHADVYDIEVIFVEEKDELINPLGIKGVGEIGVVGVSAAIANAVYHATGVRVRDMPITLDKLRRG